MQAQGLTFNVVDTGGSGDAVVLLHGFPNNWQLWRHQVEPVTGHKQSSATLSVSTGVLPGTSGWLVSLNEQAIAEFTPLSLVLTLMKFCLPQIAALQKAGYRAIAPGSRMQTPTLCLLILIAELIMRVLSTASSSLPFCDPLCWCACRPARLWRK